MCRTHPRQPSPRRALTLAELVVALTILVGLASLVVPLLSSSVHEAQDTTTRASMNQLRDVIVGKYRLDFGDKKKVDMSLAKPWRDYRLPRPIDDIGNRPDFPQLRYLFVNPSSKVFNPDTRYGWRGPYVMNSNGVYQDLTIAAESAWIARGFTNHFGVKGDPTILDGWGNPIVIVEDQDSGAAQLRSAGPDGILGVSLDANGKVTVAPIHDDRWLDLN